MNRRRLIFWLVVGLTALISLIVLYRVAGNIYGLEEDVTSAPSADNLEQIYQQLTIGEDENAVVASMGRGFRVEECKHEPSPIIEVKPGGDTDPLPTPPPGECSHTYHYTVGQQSWNLTFDMDGKLLSKKVSIAEQ